MGYTSIQSDLKIGDTIEITDDYKKMGYVGSIGVVDKITRSQSEEYIYFTPQNGKFKSRRGAFRIHPDWWGYELYNNEWDS